jgi:lysophospholipase L1-like esterase
VAQLSRRRRGVFWALTLALPLLIGLLALGVAEVVLRVAGGAERRAAPPEDDGSLLAVRKDRDLAWSFPPNAMGVFRRGAGEIERTDRWGLRNPEHADASVDAADLPTVVLLGDSIVFGWRVREADTFARRIETLARERGRPIRVVNAGVPGYGIYQQHALLERLLPRLRIDAVVSTLTLSNDGLDERRIRRFAPGRLLEYTPKPPDSRLAALARSSRALAWLERRRQNLVNQWGNVAPSSVARVEESLSALLATCEAHGIPVLLVVCPRQTEVTGGDFGVGDLLTRGMRRMHARVAREAGVPVVDLTEALARENERAPVFFEDDAHWTPAGHRAAAEALVGPVLSLVEGAPGAGREPDHSPGTPARGPSESNR